MLKGAAKTLTANRRHTHPTALARCGFLIMKLQTRRIKQKPPTITRRISLIVKSCHWKFMTTSVKKIFETLWACSVLVFENCFCYMNLVFFEKKKREQNVFLVFYLFFRTENNF